MLYTSVQWLIEACIHCSSEDNSWADSKYITVFIIVKCYNAYYSIYTCYTYQINYSYEVLMNFAHIVRKMPSPALSIMMLIQRMLIAFARNF